MGVMRNLPVVPICRSRRILIAPPNHQHSPARPVLEKRALRGRHERGGGMRWTLWRRKTSGARRTEKSCGPDAPTLVSRSWSDPRTTVAKEPGHRGEHEVTVKTIAQGRPGFFGEPVVTTLVCLIHFACEAAGAAGTRLSLPRVGSSRRHARRVLRQRRRHRRDQRLHEKRVVGGIDIGAQAVGSQLVRNRRSN
jgi:hypothetical protein